LKGSSYHASEGEEGLAERVMEGVGREGNVKRVWREWMRSRGRREVRRDRAEIGVTRGNGVKCRRRNTDLMRLSMMDWSSVDSVRVRD